MKRSNHGLLRWKPDKSYRLYVNGQHVPVEFKAREDIAKGDPLVWQWPGVRVGKLAAMRMTEDGAETFYAS